jgi:hypothetical protein
MKARGISDRAHVEHNDVDCVGGSGDGPEYRTREAVRRTTEPITTVLPPGGPSGLPTTQPVTISASRLGRHREQGARARRSLGPGGSSPGRTGPRTAGSPIRWGPTPLGTSSTPPTVASRS